MNIKQRMSEIKAELKQLRGSIATAPDAELDNIETKINSLTDEYAKLEKRLNMQTKAQRAAMSEEPDDEGDADEDEEPDDEGDADEDEDHKARSIYTVGASGTSKKQRAKAEQVKKRAAQAEAWKKHN